jgi:two-component system phosphate regulon sensor histidine kinase PhoR
MDRSFSYSRIVVAVATAIIVISTITLSIVSYRYTVGRENVIETSLIQLNYNLARQQVDHIEKKIIDNDRLLYDMADVDAPAEWPAQAERIKTADLNVDQVWFLRPNGDRLYPPYSPEIRKLYGAFTSSFRAKELDLDKLASNQTHHLHQERADVAQEKPDRYFFASYVMKQDRKGEKFIVCYQMNTEKMVSLMDGYLRDLLPRFYVSIVDFDGNGIYGQPFSSSIRSGKYFLELRFPSTLYKWILQVVPRNYTEIESDVRNQRRTNLIFIVLSTSVILCSLAVIYAAGRRERQLRQLKEDFISNVSHELKTPLSLIRMFSEVLVTGRVRTEQKKQEYYRVIHDESDRMSHLVANLLDFARLERSSRKVKLEKISIPQLVKKELEAHRYQIQNAGFDFDADIGSDIPDTLADPHAISMALSNLLDNSLKYSGERKEILVQVRQVNGSIALSVADKGLGIPETEQHKIFDKFYRGSNAGATQTRGSGIGLSITKLVAELHGGDVQVQSQPGQGSTFTLAIPIRSAEESPRA